MIKLFVHPLSIQILAKHQADFQEVDGVFQLRLNKRNPLFGFLHGQQKRNFHKKHIPSLCVPLEVYATDLSIKHPLSVSYSLYRYHIDIILKQIHTLTAITGNGNGSARSVYLHYGIEDEMIQFESITRAWRKYKRGRNIEEIPKNYLHKHLRKGHSYANPESVLKKVSERKMLRVLSQFIKNNMDLFKGDYNHFLLSVYNAIHSYMYYQYCDYPQATIARQENVTRQAISHRIKSARDLLNQYDKHKEINDLLLKEYDLA